MKEVVSRALVLVAVGLALMALVLWILPAPGQPKPAWMSRFSLECYTATGMPATPWECLIHGGKVPARPSKKRTAPQRPHNTPPEIITPDQRQRAAVQEHIVARFKTPQGARLLQTLQDPRPDAHVTNTCKALSDLLQNDLPASLDTEASAPLLSHEVQEHCRRFKRAWGRRAAATVGLNAGTEVHVHIHGIAAGDAALTIVQHQSKDNEERPTGTKTSALGPALLIQGLQGSQTAAVVIELFKKAHHSRITLEYSSAQKRHRQHARPTTFSKNHAIFFITDLDPAAPIQPTLRSNRPQ